MDKQKKDDENKEKESRREKGTGSVRKINDNKYYGRLNLGKKANGKPNIKCFTGKTEADVKRQIRDFNLGRKSISPENICDITFEQYIKTWLKTYKYPELKRSSFDRLEKTITKHIIPNLGLLRVGKIHSDDIQLYFNKLSNQENMLGYSSIKKIYDALNACFKHAVIRGDLLSNPMLLVKIPSKFKEANKKDIRVFTEKEVALIQEELNRKYNDGKNVYLYGEAYTIILNTGLRMGELLGLKWEDYDEENKQIHVRRNIQVIKKRDQNGDLENGYELVEQSTKSYSGTRVIDLNSNANNAFQILKQKNQDKESVICNSKGKVVKPQQLERTFYRILEHIGIQQTGVHSLRHTFASTLFLHGIDIKTVSKILGHANVSVTYNIYIHIIEKQKVEAVKILDDIF